MPELIGSGDLLRSGARARFPNPGQPALERMPGLAALRAAVGLPLWPLWAASRRCSHCARARALAPAAAGAAWIAVVALMAQAGFSGEPRYALPGAALIAVSGAVGLVRAARAGRSAARRPGRSPSPSRSSPPRPGSPTCRSCGPRRPTSGGWPASSPTRCAPRAGGTAVLACGRPYVGPLRGPLMAYRMDVAKHVVEPDGRRARRAWSSAPRSRARSPRSRRAGRFAEIARAGRWRVFAACAT